MAAVRRRVFHCTLLYLVFRNVLATSIILGPAKHVDVKMDPVHKHPSLLVRNYLKNTDIAWVLTRQMQQQESQSLSKHAHAAGVFSPYATDDDADYATYYQQDVPSIIPSQDIVDDFYLAVKWENEQLQQKNEELKRKEILPLQVSIMDRIWFALREGTLPPTEMTSLKNKSPPITRQHASSIKSAIGPGSIVEIGSGTTVLQLAKMFPDVTCVTVITDDETLETVTEMARQEGLFNLYITRADPEQLTVAVESLYYDPQILLGNLLLTNLTSLVGSLLPHEYEELLGRLLALASRSFIVGVDTSSGSQDYFAKSWRSASDLVRRACAVGGLVCTARYGGVRAEGLPGWSPFTVLRVHITHGVRGLHNQTCHRKKPHTQCELHFGEDMEDPAVLFSDHTQEEGPPSSDVMPLYALLVLGATYPTRAVLFLEALNLPFSVSEGPTRLSVQAGIFRNDFPKWSNDDSVDGVEEEATSNDADTEPAMLATNGGREEPKEPKGGWLPGVTASPTAGAGTGTGKSFPGKSFPGNARVEPVTPRPDRGVLEQLADSQVDGVAQAWNRVVSRRPTEGLQEQQYRSMGRHWDREEAASLREEQLKWQERRELARLDQAWDREGAEGVSGKKATSAGGKGDTVLRRDEKELKKAMGFLHGESAVRDMEVLLQYHGGDGGGGEGAGGRSVPARSHHRAAHNVAEGATATPRPRSTSTTFSSSHILSRPGRKSSTRPQRARLPPAAPVGLSAHSPQPARPAGLSRGPRTAPRHSPPPASPATTRGHRESRLMFRPMAELWRKKTGPSEIKSAVVAGKQREIPVDHEELARILRDDSAEKRQDVEVTARVRTKGVDWKPQPDNTRKHGPLPLPQHRDPMDGFDMTQDYVGVDTAKTGEAADRNTDYEGDTDWDLPQLGPAESVYNTDLFDHNKALLPPVKLEGGEPRRTLGDMRRGDENEAVEVMEDTEGQLLEDGDVPGGKDLGDLYDEVKVSYDANADKNKRRLLSQSFPDTKLETGFKEVYNGIPDKFRKQLQNAIRGNVVSKGHILRVARPEDGVNRTGNSEQLPSVEDRKSVVSAAATRGTASKSESPLAVERHEPEASSSTRRVETPLRFGRRRFGPGDREEAVFDAQWRAVRPQVRADMGDARRPFNVLTYGSRSQSLLGLKLARAYPSAHVLCLMPTRWPHIVARQRAVVESVGADNVVLLTADMTPALVDTLSRSPDLARYQLLGVEVYEWLLRLRLGFPFLLGRLLSLATTTFLEAPDPRQLRLLLDCFTVPPEEGASGGGYRALKGLVRRALRLVNAENSSLTLVGDGHIRLLQVRIHAMTRPVQVDCGTGMAFLSVRTPAATRGVGADQRAPGVAYLTRHHTEVRLDRAQRAFSLHLLLEAGLRDQPAERARLMGWYLRQSLHQDMCPLHVLWHNASLVYRPLFSATMPLNMVRQQTRAYNAQASLRAVVQELGPPPFSLLEYGSRGGDVVLGVARRHPASSVLALVDRDARAAALLHQRARVAGLRNAVVLNATLDERLTARLLRSPEFLRYQFMELETILRLVQTLESRQNWDFLLGQIVATGATSLLQLPSEQMLSVAMTTFFPQSYSGRPGSGKHDPQVFYLGEHPRPVYVNSEKRLVGESAKADVDISVALRTVPPHKGVGSEQLPWTLVRIDVTNLTTPVDHHFDYHLDGHFRKYILRCETINRTEPRVWLIRREDNFHIPYGSVHAVSLIALLRMGLLEEIKTSFYDKFLALPYYEDMAPWNIVFDAGNLTYIDYDSRNVTLNQLAPAAFQVIFMLMNYERTVRDFGKCHHHVKINYGINSVGRCVGSKFLGPCRSTAAPVPCGDGQCRSTYMECLRALHALETARHTRLDQGIQDLRNGEIKVLPSDSPFDKDSWRFGANGIIKDGQLISTPVQ